MSKLKRIGNYIGLAVFGTLFLVMLSIPMLDLASGSESFDYSNETSYSIEVLNGIGEQLHSAQNNLATIQAMYDSAINEVDSLVQLHCEQTVIVAKLKYNDTPESMPEEKSRLNALADSKREQCPSLFQ